MNPSLISRFCPLLLFLLHLRKFSCFTSPIGPFLKDRKVIEEDPETVLNKHYISVFTKKTAEDILPENYDKIEVYFPRNCQISDDEQCRKIQSSQGQIY